MSAENSFRRKSLLVWTVTPKDFGRFGFELIAAPFGIDVSGEDHDLGLIGPDGDAVEYRVATCTAIADAAFRQTSHAVVAQHDPVLQVVSKVFLDGRSGEASLLRAVSPTATVTRQEGAVHRPSVEQPGNAVVHVRFAENRRWE